MVLDRDSGIKGWDVAYGDVERAFRAFLEKIGPNKPFVLASHSQGSYHLIRLLEQCVEPDEAVRSCMVAAYAIGGRMPMHKYDAQEGVFKSLKESTSPTDTGCIIAWDTVAEGTELEFMDRFPGTWHKGSYDNTIGAQGKALQNTNPLTWNQSEQQVSGTRGEAWTDSPGWMGCLGANSDLGRPLTAAEYLSMDRTWDAAHIGFKMTSVAKYQPVAQDAFWAKSTAQGLKVSKIPKDAWKDLLQECLASGDYHAADYTLFYFNIRQNVAERTEAFLNGTSSA